MGFLEILTLKEQVTKYDPSHQVASSLFQRFWWGEKEAVGELIVINGKWNDARSSDLPSQRQNSKGGQISVAPTTNDHVNNRISDDNI